MRKSGENMAKEKRIKTKEERLRGEKNRLTRLFKDLPERKKKLTIGLIERAAFMRVELEDLEADLKENGWTEPFQQSEKVEPYDRARPQGQTYNTMNASYQKIIKQLHDMLPQESQQKQQDDGFEAFVIGRDGE